MRGRMDRPSRPRRMLLEALEDRVLLSAAPVVYPAVDPPAEELNDTIPRAGRVTVAVGTETVVNGEIGDNRFGDNDVDFFRVRLNKGEFLEAEALTPTGGLDPQLTLWWPDGLFITGNDDFAGTDAYVAFAAPADGYYYVAVSSSGTDQRWIDPFRAGTGQAVGTTGKYELHLTRSATFAAVVTEASGSLEFQDADGTEVEVKVDGPGRIELYFTAAVFDGLDPVLALAAGGTAETEFTFTDTGGTGSVNLNVLAVASRFDRLWVDGDVACLQVRGHLASSLEIGGNVLYGTVQRDVRGALVIVGTLEGHLVIGDDVEASGSVTVTNAFADALVEVRDDLKGTLALLGATPPIVWINSDLTGLLAYPEGGTDQPVWIGDDIEVTGRVFVNGTMDRLGVTDDFFGDATVNGDLLSLMVGDSIRPRANILVSGALGLTTVERTLQGSITAGTLEGDVYVGRDLAGNSLTVVGAATGGPQVLIGRDLSGTLTFGGEMDGSVQVGRRLSGRLTAAAGFGDLLVIENLSGRCAFRRLAGPVVVFGSLTGALRVLDSGSCSADVTIFGNQAGMLDILGPYAGELAVAGHLAAGGRTVLRGGLEAAGSVYVGLDVRHDLVFGADVRGAVEIGDDLTARLVIFGDLLGVPGFDDLVIGDRASGPITIFGLLRGDILVGDPDLGTGWLASLSSFSQFALEDPDLTEIDYLFGPGGAEGSLTVGGAIGTVRQL